MSDGGDAFDRMPQVRAIYQFARLRLPRIQLPWDVFLARFRNAYARTLRTQERAHTVPPTPEEYVLRVYALDSYLCFGCLNNDRVAWQMLFQTHTQADAILHETLRKHLCHFFPRDPDRQDDKLNTFWGNLILAEREGQTPILERYDGLRPLVPWLITVFDNWIRSEQRPTVRMVQRDEDAPEIAETRDEDSGNSQWHELFGEAAREWLSTLEGRNLLVIGLLWVHQLNQRSVAQLLGVHEGTVTRIRQALKTEADEAIIPVLERNGWTGDDLTPFWGSEMASVLNRDPRLSAQAIRKLLHELRPEALLPSDTKPDRNEAVTIE
ncbi:sigma-70 family RNA polymerase sigma factor [Tuwongella immobilis]|uniref:Rna polymerase sigma factor: Hypothetical conserved protein n=1 Tax=Tuwongella immobilis TaxID=692036 RepID=A0A6C2YT58_9BACT|nr:sigma-70 family RNA polymerase sigma factor [Tuwongella immobilis]VIP04517.1 rna polymerase sigma factor : Hypothetical conserved protein OS=uncultured planctomycete GN=HGMM_F12C05C12 PE=4 SV=1 [Tuwongella immobilis]VTS06396.1 rna polymerase sigma factor : Hypothetical conserved protein OS=uncultured planctomycete GN=HGMM_F12C05C12 PE=4 SV=1 [Tuwongella immobilis]